MWWKRHTKRFNDEILTLQKHYPDTFYRATLIPPGRCLHCDGGPGSIQHLVIFARIPTFRGTVYPAFLVYPCHFPHHMPTVWLIPPPDPPPPAHYFGNGRPCLTENEYDSAITGVIVLGWTYDWLKCYEIWRKTGKFPDGNYGKTRVR